MLTPDPPDRRPNRRWIVLLGVGLALALVALSGTAVGADTQTQSGVTANCTLSDSEAPPGTEITISAFDSQNADSYRYDYDGDGEYDTDTLTDPFETTPYDTAGTYTPAVLVRNDSTGETATASCGTLTIDENEDPNARLSVSATNPDVGEAVTFNARNTTDPDGDDVFVYEYDWTDDGTYDEFAETPREQTNTYTTPGEKTIRLRVEDEHGGVDTDTVTIFVGDRQPTARCSVGSEAIGVGESVLIDASASENADSAEFDVDGDGSYEITDSGLQAVHTYESPGTYTPTVLVRNGDRTDEVSCGTVTVTENQPPTADLTVSPTDPETGETVTFDASGSSDPDGSIVEYRWDFDGDRTVDETTSQPTTTTTYDTSGSYVPTVTVVDDDGATGRATADLGVEQPPPPPTTLCTIERTSLTVGESTTVDASGSDGPDSVAFDTDGDGEYDRTDEEDFVITVSYDTPGEYVVTARGTSAGGSDTVECGTVVVREPEPTPTPINETTPPETTTEPIVQQSTEVASESPRAAATGTDDDGPVPALPEWLVPALVGLGVLGGLGGLGYYLYPTGGGSGGGGGTTPPKPPNVPPSSKAARFETGTFLTPAASGPVTVTGLGFEPDLLTFAATTTVRESPNRPADRSAGWCHGRAARGADGAIPQSTVGLTDDAETLDGAIGVSSEGTALEIDVHTGDPPERVVGQVVELTDDGFELEFDVDGLRADRADDQYVVHYQAFSFGSGSKVEVGQFRTPTFPGSQSIPLGIDADHVTLTATNTLGTVDDRRMTDLPVGFSHGEVVGRSQPAQVVRNATIDPSTRNGTAQGVFDDRALHLVYADEGTIRGRTTATVTSLGEAIDLEYEKVYSGPAKLGSVESKLVSYVAVETGDYQPTIGYFQLPEPGTDDELSVSLGFKPRLVEFTTLGLGEMNTDRLSRASPLGFGWSHGSAISGRGGDGDRQYVLNETMDPATSTHEPHTGPAHAGVAATVRTLADGGRIVGRDEVSITGFTETGFRVTVTDIGTDRAGTDPRPYVFYKAWPDPEA